MLGVDRPGTLLKFESTEVLVSGKTILGSLFGGLKPKSDVPILVQKYMDKVMLSCCVRVHLERCSLLSHEFEAVLLDWCRNWNWISL